MMEEGTVEEESMAPGQLLLSGKFDLLFSASPPLESNKIGNKVKKKKRKRRKKQWSIP